MSDRAPAFPPLIPRPLAVAPERGTFELRPRARIVVARSAVEAADVGHLLAAALRPASSEKIATVPKPKPTPQSKAPRIAAAPHQVDPNTLLPQHQPLPPQAGTPD